MIGMNTAIASSQSALQPKKNPSATAGTMSVTGTYEGRSAFTNQPPVPSARAYLPSAAAQTIAQRPSIAMAPTAHRNVATEAVGRPGGSSPAMR